MTRYYILDAPFGTGRTTAAVNAVKGNPDGGPVMYVSPFKNEVESICVPCGYGGQGMEELLELKRLLKEKSNIALPHRMFEAMDSEALRFSRAGGYSLIIDDDLSVGEVLKTAKGDREAVLEQCDVGETGKLRWRDQGYTGNRKKYMKLGCDGELYFHNGCFLRVLNTARFDRFRNVLIITYLSEGSVLRGLLDAAGLRYQMIGLGYPENIPTLQMAFKRPLRPPFLGLIQIIGEKEFTSDGRYNAIGEGSGALTEKWFNSLTVKDKKLSKLRTGLSNFFWTVADAKSADRLWTTYRKAAEKIHMGSGRFMDSFVPLNSGMDFPRPEARAIAYLANDGANTRLIKLLRSMGAKIDGEQNVLYRLLEFIWLSRIRNGEPVLCYIPSRQVRELLVDWMERQEMLAAQDELEDEGGVIEGK